MKAFWILFAKPEAVMHRLNFTCFINDKWLHGHDDVFCILREMSFFLDIGAHLTRQLHYCWCCNCFTCCHSFTCVLVLLLKGIVLLREFKCGANMGTSKGISIKDIPWRFWLFLEHFCTNLGTRPDMERLIFTRCFVYWFNLIGIYIYCSFYVAGLILHSPHPWFFLTVGILP